MPRANHEEMSHSAGRPAVFGADELRDIWIHVQFLAAVTGKPIFELCGGREAARLSWFSAGMGDGPLREKDPRITHAVRGATLRRRYYQAQKLLDDEREPYRRLRELGASSPRFTPVSPTEAFWRKLLTERLENFRAKLP